MEGSVVTEDPVAYIGLSQASKPWYGLYLLSDVGLSVDLTVGGATSANMFAPAAMAPGGACLEMVTWHALEYGNPATQHRQGWADWCGSNQGLFVVFEDIDLLFQSKYVRVFQGKPTVAIAMVTPNTGQTNGQCWYGNIYNYDVGGWEQKAVSCGTSNNDPVIGWVAWEGYGYDPAGECPTVPRIAADVIQFADPTTASWIPITQTTYDVFGPNRFGCFNGSYRFKYPGTTVGLPANSWLALTDLFQ